MKSSNKTLLPFKQLAIENIEITRRDKLLFSELSFIVRPNEIWKILGKNGSGKTTLLKLISGLIKPQLGKIIFDNSDIYTNREYFYQHLLYLGHLASIQPELTVSENLELMSELQGEKLIESEVNGALEIVDLLGYEETPALHLSAGQKRRVSLAQLFITRRPIWILDEPFTALDQKGILVLESLFDQHCRNGGSIILSTHQDLQQHYLNQFQIQLND